MDFEKDFEKPRPADRGTRGGQHFEGAEIPRATLIAFTGMRASLS
jgi:hypothetical protein